MTDENEDLKVVDDVEVSESEDNTDPHGNVIINDGSTLPKTEEGPLVLGTDSSPVVILNQTNTAANEEVVTDFSVAEEEQPFVYLSHLDPARQADPNGVYLDDVQRRQAELTRAAIEGREPNLDNPPPIAGTPVMPAYALGNVDVTTKVPVGFVSNVTGTENTDGGQDE